MTFAKVLDDLDAVISEGEKKASALARVYFKSCKPLWGGHPYLQNHGVTTPLCDSGTLRVDPETGFLVVPMLRAAKMVSLRIFDAGGASTSWPIVNDAGTYFWSHKEPQSTTIIAASLPVGLAAVVALRGTAKPSRCLVAWNGFGDIEPRGLHGFLVIAASKDDGDEAEALAAKVGGGVIRPSGAVMANDFCAARIEAIASRQAKGGRESPMQSERTVDALLAQLLSKSAVWVPPAVGKEPSQNGSRMAVR